MDVVSTLLRRLTPLLLVATPLGCAHALPPPETRSIPPKWLTDGTGLFDDQGIVEVRAVGVSREGPSSLPVVAAAEDAAAETMIQLVSSNIDVIVGLDPTQSMQGSGLWRTQPSTLSSHEHGPRGFPR